MTQQNSAKKKKSMTDYTIKDSGKRVNYTSGMRRDVDDDKPKYNLIWLPGLTRLAEHYTKGAKKYGENNWQLANSEEEWERFKASAWRHFIQWQRGDEDEDHMSAVIFNLFAAENVRMKLILEDVARQACEDDIDDLRICSGCDCEINDEDNN
jgi:hypothetical protein